MKRVIEKARKVPRLKALLKVKNKTAQNCPVVSIKVDPRLPAIQKIQLNHWRSMTGEDSYLKEWHDRTGMTGMGTCGKACTACPYVQKGKTIKINK